MKLMLRLVKVTGNNNNMVSLISFVSSVAFNTSKDQDIKSFKHAFDLPKPKEVHSVVTNLKDYESVFVIGDVHGCHDELTMLLDKAGISDEANTSTLKLFVGDLINKGPANKRVLDTVMKMMSAFVVRGNHDEVIVRELRDSKNPDYSLLEKNAWIKDLTEDHFTYLRDLPFTISVPELNALIVHAGLVPNKRLSDQLPLDMVIMRNLLPIKDRFGGDSVCEYEATKSGKDGIPWAKVWKGPQHIYFGHDAKRGFQSEQFATGLDTGCVYGGKLTGIFIHGPQKGRIVSVAAKRVYQTTKG
ncbi:Uncharacterised protein r2_g1108 [Pycnogonum litorale]